MVNLLSPNWITAPCIVSRNALRLKINEERSINFSKYNGYVKPFVLHASHYVGKRLLVDKRTTDFLLNEKEDSFNKLPSKLILCPGMPLMLTDNINVSNGLVNGAYCFFYGLPPDVQFNVDLDNRYTIETIPDYILVKFDPIGEYGIDESKDGFTEENNYGYRFNCLSNLPPGVVPIFPKKASHQFVVSGKHVPISRQSFPLQLRFSYNGHWRNLR